VTHRLLQPPIIPDWSDPYPEVRDTFEQNPLEHVTSMARLFARRRLRAWLIARPLKSDVRKVIACSRRLEGSGEAELLARVRELRPRLRRDRLVGRSTAEAFALVAELAHRLLGLRPFENQLLGGIALLRGVLVEMETGEGKTLTATLPAAVAALAGVPVHVFTVNDYLAQRDAEFARPLFSAMGLSIGTVGEGMEEDARRTAYAADVVYGTNKQIVFDYLRDSVRMSGASSAAELKATWLAGADATAGAPLLRGLHMAIIDEADSILIDEARTPLVLSRKRPAETEAEVARDALSLAGTLAEGLDYRVHALEQRVDLTPRGKEAVAAAADRVGPLLRSGRRREEAVLQALFARHLLRRDEHYLVDEDKVHIIDEYTGRLMSDRSWSLGLHQMVEIKEGCPPSDRSETLAQITFQRFFRRYYHLAGMTGTGREVERELWSVYKLPMLVIPPRRTNRRIVQPAVIAGSTEGKWQCVIDRVRALSNAGQAVLVGTRTVRASAEISQRLTEEGLVHSLLSAANHREEAAIVVKAGEAGQITVATNMAGRGTDIKLGPGVAERGGLVVIVTERHDSGRIDRQLIGRCARQGDPGLAETYLALDDEQLQRSSLRRALGVLAWLLARSPAFGQVVGRAAFRLAQREQERLNADIREACVAMDLQLARMLAFSGSPE